MPTNYTSLLGFALPTTGELTNTWGTVVNNSITELVEDSIAATATASVTAGDWTLSTTGAGVTNEARCAIIIPTGTPGVSRNVIAPSQSKAYVIINQSNAAIVFKGAATTGVTVASGDKALVAWSGTDFVRIDTTVGGSTTQVQYNDANTFAGSANFTFNSGTGAVTATSFSGSGASLTNLNANNVATGTLAVDRGGTGQVTYTNGQLLIGNTTGNTLTKATLTAGTNVTVTNSTGSITIAAPAAGSDTQVQFNDGGTATGGDSGLTYNKTTNTLTVDGIPIGTGAGNISTNIAIGPAALDSNTTGGENVAIGRNTLTANTTAFYCTAVGVDALASTNANFNTAVGNAAGYGITSGTLNTVVGFSAGGLGATANGNSAFGYGTLFNSTNGANTALGAYGLLANTTGTYNTAVGYDALSDRTADTNSAGLGYQSRVTGSNQVQLGNASTTTYAYGAVQNRSDARDKADVRDTQLGLNFIAALRPVDYKWDYRDDYLPPRPELTLPVNSTAEEKAEYDAKMDEWRKARDLALVNRDGSKKRTRYHHGLIAQEVKAVMQAQGVDFGGFQDHKLKGGEDVMSIGYNELIGPLIKAIQELKAEVDALKGK